MFTVGNPINQNTMSGGFMKPRQNFSLFMRLLCLLCIFSILLTSCGIISKPKNEDASEHTTCVDSNADHLCNDCGKAMSVCADENSDHKCDTCSKSLSECKDDSNDHKCDLCGKTISVCSEGDDHKCKFCGAVMSVCTDSDNDHLCDVCEATLSYCEDSDNNHKCDTCNEVCSICADENNDQSCDICGADLGNCADNDNDHFCDLCGNPLSFCLDADDNHCCDVCSKKISECEDKNNDHYCDICSEKISECVDKNSDHKCDKCEQTVSVCTDNNENHICDVCTITLSECEDDDSNHLCDLCSEKISECNFENGDCSVCGESRLYKHVIVLGVDGAGTFFKNTDTPNMDAIFADGAITYEGITESPSISAECWASLMHGVNASVHGITANAQGPYPIDSNYPSFFRVIRENDSSAELGSYTTWNTINNLIVEDGIGITKVGWSGTDADLTNKICNYVETASPDVLFVQFDNVDAAGHNYGFGSDEHLAKITEIDTLIGKVYESYVKAGIIDDTLFIVTTDHGGTRVPSGSYLGNHGGETPEEKEITFAVKGKTVINGGDIEDFEIRDTAAIVLHALGYEQPETWTARVPSGLFQGVTAKERPTWTPPTKELSDYVDKNVLTHLNFDSTIADKTGNYTTTSKGTITYTEGYLGNAASVNNSSVTLENFSVGTDNLTFSTWLNVQSLVGSDPVVFANKSWRSGKNAGILVCVHALGYVQINVADGTNRTDLKVNYDADALNDWMHLIVVIDRDSNQIRLSINFSELQSLDMDVNLKNVSFDTEYDLVIGQDGTGAYTSYLKSAIDDFIVFDGAFDMSDVQDLATYYGEKAAEESYRGRTSKPTPDENSDGYITNYVTDKDILSYLTFDNTIEDSTGNYQTNSSATATYGSGFYGQAVQVSKSAVNIEDFNPGANSVTFATWLKVTKLEGGDPVIFANKSWSSGKNAGILVCLHSTGELRVNIADGTNRTDFIVAYPTDILDGWMHLIVVYDVENNEIRVSFDFGSFLTGKLTPENYGDSIDGAYDLAIGEDGTNGYSAYIKGYIDEFMIFDGAFDQNDVSDLEEYYNQYQKA